MNTNLNAWFFVGVLLLSGYLMHRGEEIVAGLVFSMGCLFIFLYSASTNRN